ncbi:MAG: flavodoxin [Clostridiales bacterium]|nr:flavodoxin [Clostridiales bacterium]
MNGIGIIYWSGTGNTQAMAEAMAEAIQAEATAVSGITAEAAAAYDRLLLGCPAMGAEVLEEDEFEPFFAALEPHLAGKRVALFGSYGWGDGEWMREWESRVQAAGAILFEQGLIINETPDAAGLAECRAFAGRFAA